MFQRKNSVWCFKGIQTHHCAFNSVLGKSFFFSILCSVIEITFFCVFQLGFFFFFAVNYSEFVSRELHTSLSRQTTTHYTHTHTEHNSVFLRAKMIQLMCCRSQPKISFINKWSFVATLNHTTDMNCGFLLGDERHGPTDDKHVERQSVVWYCMNISPPVKR